MAFIVKMIPLNRELNWLLTVIMYVDKRTAIALCYLNTLIPAIYRQINITLYETALLPSW